MNLIQRNGMPCPNPSCGSHDAYGIIPSTGVGHCLSCGVNVPPEKALSHIDGQEVPVPSPEKVSIIQPLPEVYRSWPARGLSEETVKRYRVAIGKEDSGFEARYPIFSPDGKHIANKTRREGKKFSYEGDAGNQGVFGRHAFPSGGLYLTVCEGNDDAMAVHQMSGNKYAAVSVHSASTALRDVKKDFEYLNSFGTIVVCMDNDDAGKRAAQQIASAGFPFSKIKILNLRKRKDPNEYLINREADVFTKEWWGAEPYRPDGLKLGTDIWQEIIDRKESFTVDYPMQGLNKLTFGIRLSELVVVTADTGVGKTAFLKHIEHELLTNEVVKEKKYGVGFLHLEEPNGDTALGLLSIHNRVPYHIPGIDRPEADLRKAYDEVLNNDRVVIWDHFGSNSVDAVLEKVRHMAALGCKYIVLDHLSIVVSDQSGDERKQLDEITTKLKTLTMELDLAVLAVIHTNRQGQIRGTAGVEQLANIVVRLERDKTEPDEWRRNVTKVTVEKNRFSGYTGPACYLWYNKDTARLNELDQDESSTYEAGGSCHVEGFY